MREGGLTRGEIRGMERWMAYQNNANLSPPPVITLVYNPTNTRINTHTQGPTHCKSFLPMLIKAMKKSTVGMW